MIYIIHVRLTSVIHINQRRSQNGVFTFFSDSIFHSLQASRGSGDVILNALKLGDIGLASVSADEADAMGIALWRVQYTL